jgi:hypothetical protein
MNTRTAGETMTKLTRPYLPLLLAATVLAAAPACATGPTYPQRVVPGDRDDRVFYDRGFREGRESGVDDVRQGRSFDIHRHRAYRDMDTRGGADRGDFRAYRRGFEAGYEEGYRRVAREVPRERIVSPAVDNGYRDGLEDGARDAHRGGRFDPVRSPRYRTGDGGYERRFGPIDIYKRDYRGAFQRGYEEGYRQVRR